MSKTTRCIAQTINLAKAKPCRGQGLRKLVSADSPGDKNVHKNFCRPSSVRVCTLNDLRRTLPPEVCECPQKSTPPTLLGSVWRWAKNIAKCGVAGGFIYWTTAEGFWGDGEEAEGLYRRIMATVAPVFDEIVEADEVRRLPHIENLRYDLLDYYNRFVLLVVGVAVAAPIYLEEKIREVLFPCEDEGVEKRGEKG